VVPLSLESWSKRSAGSAGSRRGRGRTQAHEASGILRPQLATLRNTTESAIRERALNLGIHPVYKTVDTCAGEFPSSTP